MSSFGALQIDARSTPFDARRRGLRQVSRGTARAWASSSCGASALERARRQLPFARHGPVRPVGLHAEDHAVALHAADPRGGRLRLRRSRSTWRRAACAARRARYAHNCRTLIEGMARSGCSSFLPAAIQAPIIVTFYAPDSPHYTLQELLQRGQGARLHPLPGQAHDAWKRSASAAWASSVSAASAERSRRSARCWRSCGPRPECDRAHRRSTAAATGCPSTRRSSSASTAASPTTSPQAVAAGAHAVDDSGCWRAAAASSPTASCRASPIPTICRS